MDELRSEMAAIHLQQELDVARANCRKMLAILRAVKAGAVNPAQIVIDGDNLQLLDPTQTPVVLPDAGPPKETPEG